MSEAPKLVDNSAKFYLFNTLQKCHQIRIKYHSIALNAGVFLFFFLITGAVLYYCYKTKTTPKEKTQKVMEDQEYILSKIRYYQETNQKINNLAKNYSSDITDLPIIQNPLETLL